MVVRIVLGFVGSILLAQVLAAFLYQWGVVDDARDTAIYLQAVLIVVLVVYLVVWRRRRSKQP